MLAALLPVVASSCQCETFCRWEGPKAQSHFYPLPLPFAPSKQGGGVRGRGTGFDLEAGVRAGDYHQVSSPPEPGGQAGEEDQPGSGDWDQQLEGTV